MSSSSHSQSQSESHSASGSGSSPWQRAVAQAARPQPVQVRQDLLLPAPSNIIFELFGTVVREPSSFEMKLFVETHLAGFLESHWSDKAIRRAVARLRREQTIHRFATSRA